MLMFRTHLNTFGGGIKISSSRKDEPIAFKKGLGLRLNAPVVVAKE